MFSPNQTTIEIGEWQSGESLEHAPSNKTGHVMLIVLAVLVLNAAYWVFWADDYLKMSLMRGL